MRRIHALVLAALMGCRTNRSAAPDASANTPPRRSPEASALAIADAQIPDERRALMRQFRAERERRVSDRGEMFARIAVRHDYSGEYVLLHDQDVTAFLDIKDPQHPRYQPGHDEDGPVSTGMVRVHILVVPNQPRETIGRTIASNITAEDLELTLRVMHAARDLATRLAIQNANIYVKSPARVGVGYLHVHLVGERNPNVPYPPPLP
jgi:diadenosine tetraphosphate (Ap4A) HIT family hydrolase